MSLLGRMFGSGTTVDKIRKAFSRNDWAEVLLLAERPDGSLSAADQALIDEMTATAGNRLAQINLEHGEACLRGDDFDRAREHFELATSHARDIDLQQAARELLGQLVQTSTDSVPPVDSCTSCSSDRQPDAVDHENLRFEDVEAPEEVWELTLAAMPPRWAESYGKLDAALQEAVMLAHAGQDAAAERLFLAAETDEHSEVSRYELASLYLRGGETERGLTLLEAVLRDVPDHDLALILAIDLVMQKITLPWLPELLRENLRQEIHPGLCHAGLAKLAALAADEDLIITHSQAALNHGFLDHDLMVWTSRVLEQRGEIDAAESLLKHLPGGGGCSGGTASPLLGEFLLRHKRKPDLALDSFKDAARQEPENPRWALRIAQTYLLKGWKKEGSSMVTQILQTPQLDPALREEAIAALEASGN